MNAFTPAIEALERELAAVEARAAGIRAAIDVLRGGAAEREPVGAGAAMVDAWAPRETASDPAEKINTLVATPPANAPRPAREPRKVNCSTVVAEKNDQAVLDAIRAIGPRTSAAELGARVGMHEVSVKRVLGRLTAAGKVRAEGWARGRRYFVAGDAPAPADTPKQPAPPPSQPKRDDSLERAAIASFVKVKAAQSGPEPKRAPEATGVDRNAPPIERLRQHLINVRASGAERVAVAGICEGLGLTGHECGKALWALAEEKAVVLHTSGVRATVDIAGIGEAA